MSTDSLRTRALEALTDLAAFTALRIEEAGDKKLVIGYAVELLRAMR